MRLDDDIISVSDLTERYEELESEVEGIDPDEEDSSGWQTLKDEFDKLKEILEELKGNGGDEQWKGDWYPNCLIKESYFTEYSKDLCEDIGDIPSNLPSYIVIDWKATAENLKVDYTEIEINGNTYLYR
jgi:hypothetical protein